LGQVDGKRRSLDSTRTRPRRSTDEHETGDEGERRHRQRSNGHGVESCGPRSHRLEQPGPQTGSQARLLLGQPQDRQTDRPPHDERAGDGQNHTGVKRQWRHSAPRSPRAAARHNPGQHPQLAQYHVPQAAEDDEEHDHRQRHRVVFQIHEILTVYGETGVAESRDAVKDGRVQRPPCTVGPKQTQEQHQRSQCLYGSHRAQDACEQLPKLGRRIALREGILQSGACGERHTPAQHPKDDGGEGHDSQAAQLNEEHDHDLPKHRVVPGGIHHHQPGDTDGRGGREQSVERIHATRKVAWREHEEKRPHGDGQREPPHSQRLRRATRDKTPQPPLSQRFSARHAACWRCTDALTSTHPAPAVAHRRRRRTNLSPRDSLVNLPHP